MRLVHYQRGVELAQPQQVAAEHPADTERGGGGVRSEEMLSRVTLKFCVPCEVLPVDLLHVCGEVEEEAAPLQHHQDQMG